MNYDLRGKTPAIPVGSLVLVTGVNGYIGSHVADQLLQAGYRVRGTVRDEIKGAGVRDLFAEKYGQDRIEIVTVADMVQPGAYDEACKGISRRASSVLDSHPPTGVSGVAHVASDMTFAPDPNKVVPGMVAAAMGAASAAAKQASVKRFVYTSSFAAITNAKPNVEHSISVSQWNDEAVADAWAPPPYTPDRGGSVYAASKVQAEQALWKFAAEQTPAFALNVILPNFNLGLILTDKQRASSGQAVKHIYDTGQLNPYFVKMILPQWMVDVRDTARLHVAALIDPEVENQRILAFAHPFNWNDILACLRKLDPSRALPDDVEGLGRDLCKLDNGPGEEMLKRFGRKGWTPFEETIKANVGL
ncbi:MAG: hypothetical protein LQ348_006359 [Seirophora lacunosa]|nr:MAG: hypothetical protein LQ348_006359 [Seirophora lacunosa]